MTNRILPKYPVYVPSRGRVKHAKTVRCLITDGVPFYLVVEPQEADEYAEQFPDAELSVLPERDRGLVYVRNWCLDHAIKNGHARHWQIDDNIRHFYRFLHQKRLPCRAGVALRVCEDFVDRYENVAIAGLNYDTFVRGKMPPFALNVHVYSCSLFNNSMPYRWRLRYNDDVDICLQALAGGECTVLLNAFMCGKERTMTIPGGMGKMYDGDGRLHGSRLLKRYWPGVVEIDRRYGRPHFVIKNSWRRFDTPLKRRTDINWKKIEQQPIDEYGMRLLPVKEIKSDFLKSIVEDE
jgi:hypothetical protein